MHVLIETICSFSYNGRVHCLTMDVFAGFYTITMMFISNSGRPKNVSLTIGTYYMDHTAAVKMSSVGVLNAEKMTVDAVRFTCQSSTPRTYSLL